MDKFYSMGIAPGVGKSPQISCSLPQHPNNQESAPLKYFYICQGIKKKLQFTHCPTKISETMNS